MKIIEADYTLEYPDIAFAFNPITITYTKASRTRIWVQCNNIMMDKRSETGVINFDVSAIARSLFDRSKFHNVEEQDTTLYKEMTIKVGGIKTITIPVIWGALQIGQQYSQTKNLTYFKGYPFTVPYYTDHDTTIKANGVEYRTLSKGKYNLNVADALNTVKVGLTAFTKEIISLFDYTFDFTFQNQVYLRSEDLKINIVNVGCPKDGVYLRWINKLGEYNYYLLQSSTESTEVKDLSIKYDNFYTTIDYTDGYHLATAQAIGKEIKQTVKLFASLVDSVTYRFLLDLVQSPVVDQFMGYDTSGVARWVGVSIQGATFTKTTSVLQDFECNLITNNSLVQTL